MNQSKQRIHIFCKVVDNYGDIGVCWRLSSQFAHEHGQDVTLWVDDLVSFKRICAAVDAAVVHQVVHGVTVRRWDAEGWDHVSVDEVGQIVIEGFGCALPDAYLAAMAQAVVPPVWLNLEYLSAESWVEDCHAMVSVHPTLGLKKYFYFPGFSEKTGGVLIEQATLARKAAFDAAPQRVSRDAYFGGQGIPVIDGAQYVSLFCYPAAPVATLLADLAESDTPVVCIIPEGVATHAVTEVLGMPLAAGSHASTGNLTVHCLPFNDQQGYDTLLWSCDLNFVRGEDSFVRAQLAGKPFVWHIYPQEEQAHIVKLDAFLARYTATMPDALRQHVQRYWHQWNDVNTGEIGGNYAQILHEQHVAWRQHAQVWYDYLLKNGDLATNIRRFAEKIS
jgi:uncharacterized repeat protein (TIGR03837 family)